MSQPSPLNHRTNLQQLTVRKKPLVLYEDHRSLVYVLWNARASGALPEPPLLVMFDNHDDCKQPSEEALRRARELRSRATEQEIHAFVEWELGGLDDDWVRASFELGLLRDVVLIGAEETPNTRERRNRFTDDAGIEHNVWRIGHVWDALTHQGDLTDRARFTELSDLWAVLNWPPGLRVGESPPPLARGPVVLDFDLDCFSGTLGGHRMAWLPDVIHALFNRRGEDGYSARDFIDSLEDRIALRTVARESPYCGTTRESQIILESLDATLWDGELFSIR